VFAPPSVRSCWLPHVSQVRLCSLHGKINIPSSFLPSQSSSSHNIIPDTLRPRNCCQRRIMFTAPPVTLLCIEPCQSLSRFLYCRRNSTLSRLNIPTSSTVLAAFSRPAKIDAATFHSWLTVLKSVVDAVLLLIDFNVEGVTAMRAAASAAGLGADRVIAVPSMAEGIYVA
jgi:hypothetical protein